MYICINHNKMTAKQLRRKKLKIAYVFFLIIGMLGITYQFYKYISDSLNLSFSEGALTVMFGMFIFKPMLILDLFDDIRVKMFGAKSRIFDRATDTGGGDIPVEDEEV